MAQEELADYHDKAFFAWGNHDLFPNNMWDFNLDEPINSDINDMIL